MPSGSSAPPCSACTCPRPDTCARTSTSSFKGPQHPRLARATARHPVKARLHRGDRRPEGPPVRAPPPGLPNENNSTTLVIGRRWTVLQAPNLESTTAFRIAGGRVHLRHPGPAPIGDLDPDHAVPRLDRDRDRLAGSTPERGMRAPASVYPHRSLAPVPVRYMSVDPATMGSTTTQDATRRDRAETARLAENSQLAGRFRRWWSGVGFEPTPAEPTVLQTACPDIGI